MRLSKKELLGRILTVILIIAIIFGLFYLVGILDIKNSNELLACDGCAKAYTYSVSPSGKYKLLVEVKGTNGPQYYFIAGVLDSENNVIKDLEGSFSTSYSTAFMWDKKDNIWGYSSENGFYLFERNTETWEVHLVKSSGALDTCIPKEILGLSKDSSNISLNVCK